VRIPHVTHTDAAYIPEIVAFRTAMNEAYTTKRCG
jgi:hypothetical protein